MRAFTVAWVVACIAAAAPAARAANRGAHDDWSIPAPGSCEAARGERTGDAADAGGFTLRPGTAVAFEQLASLRALLPKPVWDARERFFHEGMRIQIGPFWYFDLQTLAPLYSIEYGKDGRADGIAIHASRWSEDRPDYPRWPDDPTREIRVLDSAGAFYATESGRGSWRRESYDFVATPPDDKELQHLASVTSIERGH